jgi:hypothetical protein
VKCVLTTLLSICPYVSTTIHRPASGFTTLLRGRLRRCPEFILPRPVCNYIYRIMLQFMSLFAYLSLMWSVTFFMFCLWFELCNPVASGLLQVPATYLGSFGYFLSQDPVLLNGCSSEKQMLTGGPECTACLARFCTLSVCTLPP